MNNKLLINIGITISVLLIIALTGLSLINIKKTIDTKIPLYDETYRGVMVPSYNGDTLDIPTIDNTEEANYRDTFLKQYSIRNHRIKIVEILGCIQCVILAMLITFNKKLRGIWIVCTLVVMTYTLYSYSIGAYQNKYMSSLEKNQIGKDKYIKVDDKIVGMTDEKITGKDGALLDVKRISLDRLTELAKINVEITDDNIGVLPRVIRLNNDVQYYYYGIEEGDVFYTSTERVDDK